MASFPRARRLGPASGGKTAPQHLAPERAIHAEVAPVSGQHFCSWGDLGQADHAGIGQARTVVCISLQPAQQLRRMRIHVERRHEIAIHEHLHKRFRLAQEVCSLREHRCAGRQRSAQAKRPRPRMMDVPSVPVGDEKPCVSDLWHGVGRAFASPSLLFVRTGSRAAHPTADEMLLSSRVSVSQTCQHRTPRVSRGIPREPSAGVP